MLQIFVLDGGLGVLASFCVLGSNDLISFIQIGFELFSLGG